MHCPGRGRAAVRRTLRMRGRRPKAEHAETQEGGGSEQHTIFNPPHYAKTPSRRKDELTVTTLLNSRQ